MNTAGLKKAARLKSDRCFSKAMNAIDKLRKEGVQISFSAVMEEAHVSRGYLYGNAYLRGIIEQERAASQNQSANLQTLYAAQEVEIKRLTRELDRMKKLEAQVKELKQKNAELSEQLKTAYKY